MPLAALHVASSEQRTGVFTLTHASATWRLRVEMVRGWIHGFGIEPSPDPEPPRRPGERRQRDAQVTATVAPTAPAHPPHERLAHVLAIAVRAGFVLTPLSEPRLPHVATTPFHPLATLRVAIASLLRPVEQDAASRIDRAASYRLVAPLHASGLDPDEQTAAALLASSGTQGRTWDELLRRSRCPPQRLTVLLRDAAALGALRIGDDDLAVALRRLMIDAPAEAAKRRAAYHAQARAVHPDLHPDAGPEEQRRLNDEMAELAEKKKRGAP